MSDSEEEDENDSKTARTDMGLLRAMRKHSSLVREDNDLDSDIKK